MSRALVFSFLAAFYYYVSAQPPQCSSGFQWSFNSEGQSPCDMATALGAVCAGSAFSLQPLNAPGLVYTGPPQTNANNCRCSSVYYSLLCACSVCQLHDFISWSNYNVNCSSVYVQVFPEPLPSNVNIPHYAYLDVSASNGFNTTAAMAAVGAESTASSQPTATVTSPTVTAPATSAASKSSKTNVGAIAGGVVGGVVFLALVAVVITLILRRRKQPANSTPAVYNPVVAPEPAMSYANNMSYNPSTPTAMVPARIYDPNDPSTFPTNDPAGYSTYTSSPDASLQRPLITPTFTGTGSVVSVPRNTTHYTGAPEL